MFQKFVLKYILDLITQRTSCEVVFWITPFQESDDVFVFLETCVYAHIDPVQLFHFFLCTFIHVSIQFKLIEFN